MEDIKESEIIKLITVTITQILGEIELVNYQLTSIELVDDMLELKIILKDSCLPTTCDRLYRLWLNVGDIKEWLMLGTEMYLEKLSEQVGIALQMKGKDENNSGSN